MVHDRRSDAMTDRSMRVLVVTGIYPPDIGGPATHADDVRRALTERGHHVTVLTLTDERRPGLRAPARADSPVVAVAGPHRRRAGRGRHRTGSPLRRRLRHRPRPGRGRRRRLAGRPVALKVVGDPAWERGVRRGLTSRIVRRLPGRPRGPARPPGDARASATGRPGTRPRCSPRARTSRRERDTGRTATTYGSSRTASAPRRRRTTRPATDGHLRLVFVGRLVAHKHLDRIITAVAQSDGRASRRRRRRPRARRRGRALADQLGVSARVHFAGALGARRDVDPHRRRRCARARQRLRGPAARRARGTRVRDAGRHDRAPRPRRSAHRRRRRAARRRRTATRWPAAFDRLAADDALRRRLGDGARADRPTVDARPVRRPARGSVRRARRSSTACGVPRQDQHARAADPRRRAEVRDQRAPRELVRGVHRPTGRSAPSRGCASGRAPPSAPRTARQRVLLRGRSAARAARSGAPPTGGDRLPEPVRGVRRRAAPRRAAEQSATAAADRGARRLAHRDPPLRRHAPSAARPRSPTGSPNGRCGAPTACAS